MVVRAHHSAQALAPRLVTQRRHTLAQYLEASTFCVHAVPELIAVPTQTCVATNDVCDGLHHSCLSLAQSHFQPHTAVAVVAGSTFRFSKRSLRHAKVRPAGLRSGRVVDAAGKPFRTRTHARSPTLLTFGVTLCLAQPHGTSNPRNCHTHEIPPPTAFASGPTHSTTHSARPSITTHAKPQLACTATCPACLGPRSARCLALQQPPGNELHTPRPNSCHYSTQTSIVPPTMRIHHLWRTLCTSPNSPWVPPTTPQLHTAITSATCTSTSPPTSNLQPHKPSSN